MRRLLPTRTQPKQPVKGEPTVYYSGLDALFPVQCSEKTCQASYDLSAFIDIVQLWGFICLTSHQSGHFGFTCPQCYRTSTKKYRHWNPEKLVEYLEEVGINTGRRYRGILPHLHKFVLFSVCDASDRIENRPEEGTANSDKDVYTLPECAQPVVAYPWIDAASEHPCFDENEIAHLVDLENQYRVKVIPRIVGFSSVYRKTEKLMLDIERPTVILQDLIETNYGQQRGLAMDREYYEGKYDKLVKNDLTTEEYLAIFRSKSYADPETIDPSDDILLDYKELRNSLDFEVIYKKRFVNKHARRLYLDSEQSVSIQSNQDEDQGCSTESVTTLQNGSLFESIGNLDSAIKAHENVFVRKGDTWIVKYCDQTTTVRDYEKIRYIAFLLKDAGQEINNCDLVAAVKKFDVKPASIEVDMEESQLDTDLTPEETQRLREVGWEILDELKEAGETKNQSRQEEAEKKWDLYRKHMLNEHGIKVALSDRQEIVFKSMRRPGPEAEKARLTVRNQIENGFKDIEKELPDLAAHLRENIHRTSWHAVYAPPTDSSIQWHVVE